MVKRGPKPNSEIRMAALALRLEGQTFKAIATAVGLSRQRVQQILSPPVAIRVQVVEAARGACQLCGIFVGGSGHVHHQLAKGVVVDDYNDIKNLRLLCISCHRLEHSYGPEVPKHIQRMTSERKRRRILSSEVDRVLRGKQ